MESIRKTANYISELPQKMEKELEKLEVLVMNTDRMGIFKEMEEMRIEELRASMNIYVELILTEPEIENQSNLIIEYRYMLKNINKKHMANQIMVELQNKINKDRLSGFIIQSHRILQRKDPQNCFKEDSQGDKTICSKSHTKSDERQIAGGPRGVIFREVPTEFNPQSLEAGGATEAVRIDKTNIKITNPDLSSFEKSKKDTLDLVTLENKKLKGDKQGLRCSFKGCDFITTITKKCKA